MAEGPVTQRERRVFYLLLLVGAVLLVTILYRLADERPLEPVPFLEEAETAAFGEDGSAADPSDGAAAERTGQSSSGASTPPGAESSTEPAMLAYITGAVAAPGVYPFKQGDRWVDAVAKAGGTTEEAELAFINLARPVRDGERIYVPREGESVPPGDGGDAEAWAGEDAAAPVRLNPNSASAAALERLPGVGPVLARRIIEERERGGPFRSPSDLVRVSGIGEATVERLAPYLLLP